MVTCMCFFTLYFLFLDNNLYFLYSFWSLTSQNVLLFQQARGREAIVAGFYHEGYEEPLLMLMKRRGVHSGLVVKVETLPFLCG